MSPDGVRERYERMRAEVGPGVTIVAATKYVSVEDMAVLAEAGIEVVGENRAQDLEAQARRLRRRVPVALHRPPPEPEGDASSTGICELVHSLDSESAARRLEVPALVEVNLSGEPTKSGIAPEELRRASSRSTTTCAG